jgi:hypothetical protein
MNLLFQQSISAMADRWSPAGTKLPQRAMARAKVAFGSAPPGGQKETSGARGPVTCQALPGIVRLLSPCMRQVTNVKMTAIEATVITSEV